MADYNRDDLEIETVELVKKAADMGLTCLVIIEDPSDPEKCKLTAPMGMSWGDRAKILDDWMVAMLQGRDSSCG